MRILRALSLLPLIFCCLITEGEASVFIKSNTTSLALRPYVEVLEDSSGLLTMADIERSDISAKFHTVAGDSDLNFSYTTSTYWLRLRLMPVANTPSPWLLEISYPSLDYVDLYTRNGNALIHQSSSDHRPFSDKPFVHRNLVFPLALTAGTEQTVYLRVHTEGSLTLPMTLWSPAALHANDQEIYSLFAIYFGMLLALGLYNLLLYSSLREHIYLTYFGFVTWLIIGQLSMLGLANQFLWPDWPTWGNIALPTGYCLTGYFAVSFTRQFLQTKLSTPRLDRISQLLQFGFIVGAAAPTLGFYSFGGIATALLGASFSAIAVISGFIAVKNHQPGARLFLTAWSLLLLGVAMLGFRTMGWVPTNIFTSYGMQIGSAFEMLLLSFALADRIHTLKREKEIAQTEALLIKEQAMNALLQSEKVLEQRIQERTSELADTNKRLRESEAAQRELANHDQLTGLGNRIFLQQQLEFVVARSQREGSTFALLVIDLDEFKPVNDSYGHAIGDEVLISIARRLEECVRVTDLISRIGGDEFVVVIEAIHDPIQAHEVGEKIIEKLSLPFEIGSRQIKVGASIGIALYPADTRETDKLFQLADQAMYEAKQAGKGVCKIAAPSEKVSTG